MSEPAAIRATFADWRTVKGRKQLQIILEVPLEQQGDVLRMLGAPNPSDPAWVALALLQEPAKAAQEPAKDKRPFNELPIAQRAALLCERAAFQAFLRKVLGYKCENPDQAASILRRYCDIDSRSALATDQSAAATFIELERNFDLWLQEPF